MPTIQQDQLIAQQTGIYFEDINDAKVSKIFHNGSDFFTCKLFDHPTNPIITAYSNEGAKKASYTMAGSYIFDVAYEKASGRYFKVSLRNDHLVKYIGTEYSFGDSFSSQVYTDGFWYPQGHDDAFSYAEDGVLKITSCPSGQKYESYSPYTYSTGVAGRLSIYRASIDYNFLLAAVPGTSGCSVCLSVQDKPSAFMDYIAVPTEISGLLSSTSNIRYMVGAINSPAYNKKFRIAVSGTEYNSNTNGHHIYGLHFNSDIIDFVNFATVSPITVNLVYQTSNEWSVVYSGASLISGNTTLAPYAYHGPYFGFALDPQVSGVAGDTIAFSIFTDSKTDIETSGSLNILRSGTGIWSSTIFSTNIDPSYTITYGINDYNAKEYSEFRLDAASRQPGMVGIELDNFIVMSGIDTNYHTISLEQINDSGGYVNTIVNTLDILPEIWNINKSYSDIVSQSGAIQLAVDDNKGAFIKVFDDVYRVNISGTYISGTLYNESSPDVSVSSGIISATGIRSFQFNNKGAERFLQYIEYDSNVEEVRVRTLNTTGSGSPTTSTREVFLNITDWSETTVIPSGITTGIEYRPCLHGTDHDTLFYFRKSGIGELNPVICSGSNGAISNSTLFISVGANFIANNVQPGDTIKLSGGTGGTGITGIVKYSIQSVSQSSLILNVNPATIGIKSALTYSIFSNAAQMQFNIDSSIAAFASLDIDDFSLSAGTGQTTWIHAQVIDCWGEPKSGKNVVFSITSGEGGLSNEAAIPTDSNGIASVQYTVGAAAGIVIIQATISDD